MASASSGIMGDGVGQSLVEDQTCSLLLCSLLDKGQRKGWQLTCWDPVAWGLMVGKEIVQAGILNES